MGPKYLNADQKRQLRQSSEHHLEFFRWNPNEFLSGDWWPRTKPGYITITQRRSNNQWSGGIASRNPPKYSEFKNPLENYSPRFFGIKTPSISLIIFQKAKLSMRSINHLCWCNWMTFRKKCCENFTNCVLSLHDNEPAHLHLAHCFGI